VTMAKAIAAFIGAMITALLGTGVIPVASSWQVWLSVISALATAVVTYAVPNRPSPGVTRVIP
jgi:hypothetical protein